MTFLSVITVVRNDPEGLQRTAQSLTEQQFADLEWIVIDGASTDGTVAALSILSGQVRQPDVLISEPDRGIYDAMNKGLVRAQGDWLTFLNAGDSYCESTTLTRVHDWLAATHADWGFGAVRNIDASGDATGMQCASPFTTAGLAFGNTTVPHQATFMRASLTKRIGAFLVDQGTAADQEYILRAAREGAPAELVWPLVDFRVGGAGMGHGATHFPAAMWRYRRTAGISVTGSRVLDSVMSLYVSARSGLAEMENRGLRKFGNRG